MNKTKQQGLKWFWVVFDPSGQMLLRTAAWHFEECLQSFESIFRRGEKGAFGKAVEQGYSARRVRATERIGSR